MTLPTFTFDAQEVKPRRGEPYLSEMVNKKFLGQPRGVYLGYLPQVTAGSLILTLASDPVYGISLARVKSSASATNVDVVSETNIQLDFTGHDFTANPTAYVKVTAASALGTTTTASIYTTSTPGSTPTDQLICRITSSGGNLVVTWDSPTNRATPYAYSGAPLGYGFMQDSAVEQLLAAVAMVTEVADARTDLAGGGHPYLPPGQQGLTDRITADLQPSAIANRLALALYVIRSNDHFVSSISDTLNVSPSFARTGRASSPLVKIDGSGSETTAGAITAPIDAERNACVIMTVGSNERLVDASRVIGYGRLSVDEVPLTGTLTFTGTTAVNGAGTLFTTELQLDDLILATDGDYYVVSTIASDTQLILSAAPPAGSGTSTRRRFTMSVVRRSSVDSSEIPLTIPGGTTIRFFFPAWFDLKTAVHDARLLMFEGGEEPPLPDATVSIKGKGIMYPGLTSALAGAVKVLDGGGPVGTGKLAYSIDFKGAALNAAPGVADITAAGPTGQPGAPGSGPGPSGPTGAPGLAFDNFSVPFTSSGMFTAPLGGWALGRMLTWDVTFPGVLKYLHGGMASWEIPTPAADGNDHFNITNVQQTGPNTARITMTVSSAFDVNGPPNANYEFFLNGAG